MLVVAVRVVAWVVVEKLLDKMHKEIKYFPREISRLFCYVWSESVKRWSVVTMKSQVLSTLAFTRFLCPMLVNPVRHGLIDKQPSNEAMRVLIQISKSFQLFAVGWAEATASPELQKENEKINLTPEMIKKQYDTIEALFEKIIEIHKDVEAIGSPLSGDKSNKKNPRNSQAHNRSRTLINFCNN